MDRNIGLPQGMRRRGKFVLIAGGLATLTISAAVAQSAGVDEVRPSPPSIGADVPVTYFGPPPSTAKPELIGPLQLLRSGELDLDAGTITLPLYRGRVQGGDGDAETSVESDVWFVLTDTTDADNAVALGLNHSPKLAYADTCRGVRRAVQEQDATLTFDRGTVDFAPERSLTPGTDSPFPPDGFTPGSIGDEFYTPLVRILNAGDHVYNAPVVASGSDEDLNAFCDGDPDYSLVHDKVVSICPRDATVTLRLTPGFSFAKPVLYISTDSNNEMAATMEGATYAPAMSDIAVGRDDSAFSAVERLFAVTNGPTNLPVSETGGVDEVHPQRQGFNSAILGEGGPLNVLGGIPTVATDYSPLWDVNAAEWTDEAIAEGYRARVTEEFQILGLVQSGHMTGPGGSAFGSTGIVVNCPIVHRFL